LYIEDPDMTEPQKTLAEIDPGAYPLVVDVKTSPLPMLSFEDVITHRLHELQDSDIKQASKLPVKADDILYQAIAIIEEYNIRSIRRGSRFFQFLYGYLWIEFEYATVLAEINSIYLRIIHSDNGRCASEAMHPGAWVLKQEIWAGTNAPIQLYIYPHHHERIETNAARLGVSMSDYTVICLWAGALASNAPLPQRVREHGIKMMSAFKERCEIRLQRLTRIESEL
jgi:hypothetical protein